MIRIILVGSFLVLNTIWDVRTKKIPIMLLVCFGAAGIIINIFLPEYTVKELAFGVAIGVALWGISYVTGGQIGSGDGLLFMVTGLLIGGINNFVLLLWSTALCAVVSAVLLFAKRVSRKDRIPFVPFVLLAYVGQVVL